MKIAAKQLARVKEPPRSIQRRRACHHHHDNGPGIEDAAGIKLTAFAASLSSWVPHFMCIGIYQNSEHHMLYSSRHVSGGILWANLPHVSAPLPEDIVQPVFRRSSKRSERSPLGAIDWIEPGFLSYLQQLIRYGFGKRIMFGSDQMTWPDAIGLAVETIEKADFLSAGQKRDILYNNAASFLRLPAEQIAKHYADSNK